MRITIWVIGAFLCEAINPDKEYPRALAACAMVTFFVALGMDLVEFVLMLREWAG